MVNQLGSLSGGRVIDAFDLGREAKRQNERRNALMEFGTAALGGDEEALNRLALGDPETALQIGQFRVQQDAAAAREARDVFESDRSFGFQQSEAARAQGNFETQQGFREDESSRVQANADRQHELNAQNVQSQIEARINADNRAERQLELDDLGQLQDLAESGQATNEQLFDLSQKLRKEFVDLSDDFITVRDAFGRIQATAGEGANATGISDVGLVFQIMKMFDPGSTVREGEQALARQATGVPGQVLTMYNRLINGETLTPEQRQQFVAVAQQLFQQAETQQQQNTEFFTREAQLSGLDPTRVVIPLGAAGGSDTAAQPTQGGAQQQGQGTQDNPARVTTIEEAQSLPSGAFFVDPETGELRQRN